VDDDEAIRGLLHEHVLALGHVPLQAENGLSGLAHVRRDPPDLVLLDMNMPGLDGKEVLARMRNDPRLRETPVIVISGIGESGVAVECIAAGAEDFIPKPFDPRLLRARIGSSLDRRRMRLQEQEFQRRIEEYSLELEDRVREKTRDLREAHRRLSILDEAKNDFLTLISHELRTPMTGLLGASEILLGMAPGEAERREFEEVFRLSLRRLMRIVEDALLLTRVRTSPESAALAIHPIRRVLEAAVEAARPFAEARGVRLAPVPATEARVPCEEELLTRALASLLECAVKFSRPGTEVGIACGAAGDHVEVRVSAEGGTIPGEALPRFFEVLAIRDPITPGGDLGLGPPLAARILRLCGGSVAAANLGEEGVAFTARLPAAPVGPVS